jgi:hypothetical protein
MKVIPINGVLRSGKDKFVEFVSEQMDNNIHFATNISTIDPVKNAMRELGWNGEKTPEWRNMMAEMKQIWIKRMNGPFNYVKNLVEMYSERYKNESYEVIHFIHCREPEEIQKLKDEWKDNCLTLLIRNECREKNFLINGADNVVFDYNYDHTIFNNSNLDNLKIEARTFINDYLV